MHGIIFIELRKFVETRLGAGSWAKLATQTKLGPHLYIASGSYPDADLFKMVGAASQTLGMETADVVESFGVHLASALLQTYGSHIKPEWSAIDLLERIESTMHAAVRSSSDSATPPRIEALRVATTRVVLKYRSSRRLCSLAKGLIRGVGRHYGTALVIKQPECMLTGAPQCTFEVDVDPTRTTGAVRVFRPS